MSKIPAVFKEEITRIARIEIDGKTVFVEDPDEDGEKVYFPDRDDVDGDSVEDLAFYTQLLRGENSTVDSCSDGLLNPSDCDHAPGDVFPLRGKHKIQACEIAPGLQEQVVATLERFAAGIGWARNEEGGSDRFNRRPGSVLLSDSAEVHSWDKSASHRAERRTCKPSLQHALGYQP